MTDARGVTIDVTTIIGAQEYAVSRNQNRTPRDPFARECFAEAVQTLIFNTNVYVVHPTVAAPQATDFGDEPLLLRSLLARRLVRPLRLTAEQARECTITQTNTLRILESDGARALIDYIEHTLMCDSTPGVTTIANRIRAWSEFQAREVRTAARHHVIRIPTADGIEDDEIGHWTRATAASLRGRLGLISPVGQEAYVLAFLTRGLKYKSRADVGGSCYQAHPARRDFIVSFEFAAANTDSEHVLDVVKMVRGIHETMLRSADERRRPRMLLLEFELPLLGGRLWTGDETGKQPDYDWLNLLSDRIADYKTRSAELRNAISQCLLEEDHARLTRDIEEVKYQLLERLGLRDVQLSPVERDLVKAASVAESTIGLPKVSGLWIGPRTVGKRMMFRGNPYQQFLYREFLGAWKRTAQ